MAELNPPMPAPTISARPFMAPLCLATAPVARSTQGHRRPPACRYHAPIARGYKPFHCRPGLSGDRRPRASAMSLDYICSTCEQLMRKFYSERLRGLQVDGVLQARMYDRRIGTVRITENLSNIDT